MLFSCSVSYRASASEPLFRQFRDGVLRSSPRPSLRATQGALVIATIVRRCDHVASKGPVTIRHSSTAMSKVTGARWIAWEGRHALDLRTGRLFSAPSCPGSFLRRGAHHARYNPVVRPRIRLRQPRLVHTQQPRYTLRYGVDYQTLYCNLYVTADRQRPAHVRHASGGALGPGRHIALEGNQRSSLADPYLGYRRRRRRRSGRTLRRCVEGKAQLLRHRNPRLPAPIRQQAGQLPPRRRLPLLQLRLRPPGTPDRSHKRDELSRVRPRQLVRRSGDDRLRFLADGPRQPQRRRRM